MIIIGAGLSGLLAGVLNPASHIYEAKAEEDIVHRALLRFREDKISKATGIDFHRVTVRKGIWDWEREQFVSPSITQANLYSAKVINSLSDRSIWSIEPVERYIAPENFIEQLIELNRYRLHWECLVERETLIDQTTISTMPMLQMLRLFPDVCQQRPDFHYQPIVVDQYRINANVHQTVYFPSPATTIYRASITGSLLIVERIPSRLNEVYNEEETLNKLDSVFAFLDVPQPIRVNHVQEFGKIAPIEDKLRKSIMFNLSAQHGIFSLGRYATWRNILLDDVYNDIFVIRRLIHQSNYDLSRNYL